MKTLTAKRGFSLIELLTVIAIIAILAAIIFPVMARVKETARLNQCMTNLQQIGVAVSMFKQDNRRYPAILGSEVVMSGGVPEMFENAKDKYLFPEYTKSSIKVFHCPSSVISNSRDIAAYLRVPGDEDSAVATYAYDSYDASVSGPGERRVTEGYTLYDGDAAVSPHYRLNWAPSVGDVAGSPRFLEPYPPAEVKDSVTVQQQDFERQLRWRNPPSDTVITWCSYHEGSNLSGKVPVVFLDGHADTFPAKEFEACKWRVRAKKS